MSASTRTFRPAPPRLREYWGAAVFAILTLMGVYALLFRPHDSSPLPVLATAVLLAAWLWLLLRNRFPGSPTLTADSRCLTYRRGRREERAEWSDIVAVHADYVKKEMLFLRRAPERPIVVHRDMVAADGTRLDVAFEDYWTPPGGA